MLVGILALAYLSINLGRVDLFGRTGYVVYADFPTVGGLQAGASVEIAGVPVGRVESIRLREYQARVALQIDDGVKLQDDAIVSIKTKGLIGEKFVQISPGGSDKLVTAGGRLTEVEAPVDFEELLSKYVFGKV
jgi:phospholipid/cholesterol/gamma-HCH transport system substrate-binding protein